MKRHHAFTRVEALVTVGLAITIFALIQLFFLTMVVPFLAATDAALT